MWGLMFEAYDLNAAEDLIGAPDWMDTVLGPIFTPPVVSKWEGPLGTPASACFRIPMICSSVNRFRFM